MGPGDLDGPLDQGIEVIPQQFPGLLAGQVAVTVELLVGEGHDLQARLHHDQAAGLGKRLV